MATNHTNTNITELPSGRYAVRVAPPTDYDRGPVVQVLQNILDGNTEFAVTGTWFPTPARWYANDAAEFNGRMAIDFGAGWFLEADDTAAVAAFAKEAQG